MFSEMSPPNSHDNNAREKSLSPPPLKISKDSHSIKKSTLPQLRHHPVIIYTHSPKVIHTHPRDFKALVQKLTGMSRPDEESVKDKRSSDPKSSNSDMDDGKKIVGNDDNEFSSLTREENFGSLGDQINSCIDQRSPYFSNIPIFTPNLGDFMCPKSSSIYNYTDPGDFMCPKSYYTDSLLLNPIGNGSIKEFQEHPSFENNN